MSDTAAIRIKDLYFSYNGVPVLSSVNVAIEHREAVCMVGPNGGGKTTLLKLILGLLKPDRGEISVFGKKPEMARRSIGYVPQHMQFDPDFPISVRDVVAMGRIGERSWPAVAERRRGISAALDEVGLASRADASFAELSGGQRQRVLIARALFSNPEILLLDEPTAMIDLAVETQLLVTLQELHRRMTIVLVSHDLGFVSRIVRSVICVNKQVVVHPTSELSGKMIEDVYGTDLAMIRHDHRCTEGGHYHV